MSFTKYLILFIVGSLALLLSCKENHQKQFFLPAYSKTDTDSITIEPTLLLPVKMLANDSVLIIIDLSTDTLFRVFSQPDLTYLGWFGKKGRGPNEFVYIDPSGTRFYNETLQIVDLRNIYLITFTSSSISNNYTIKERIPIPGELLTFNHVFRLDTNKFCGVCLLRASQESLDCFNRSTKEIFSFLDYPDFIKDTPENEKRSIYSFSLDIKPDLSQFALNYTYSPLLRICNLKGEIIHETFIKGLPEQILFQNLGKRTNNLLNGISYYKDIKTTNKFIYLFYYPQGGVRINEHRYENYSIGQKELHIFNWQGKPLARIKLDKSTLSFVPSCDDRYLYYTSEKSPNKIFILNLANISKDNTYNEQ